MNVPPKGILLRIVCTPFHLLWASCFEAILIVLLCAKHGIKSLIATAAVKLAETVNLLKLWTTVASQPYVGFEWFLFGAVERNVYFKPMHSHAMFTCCIMIVSSSEVATLLLVHYCLYKVDTLLPCVYSTVSPIDACNIPLWSFSCLLSLHVLHLHVCIPDHNYN